MSITPSASHQGSSTAGSYASAADWLKASPPRRHRFWIPLTVLGLAAAILATPFLLEARGVEFDPLNYGMVAETFCIIGTLTLVSVWWLCFSGFTWKMRRAVLFLLLLAGAGFGATVRKVSVVTIRGYYLAPKFTFRWEKKTATAPKDDSLAVMLTASLDDYPRFRGLDVDGIAPGVSLAGWEKAPTRKWGFAFSDDRAGYAGFAVAGQGVVTLEQRGTRETVVCYDRATGHERWAHAYDAYRPDPMGNGPRATPTIDRGEVFSYGATGKLVCLDGGTGTRKWEADVMTQSESTNVLWGQSGSPLVVDDLVIVNPGVDPAKPAGKAVCAYDRKTGQRVWASGNHKTGYSSPRLATLLGVRQVLLFDAGGLAGFDLTSGRELWRFAWETYSDMNIMVPLVVGGDRVFISSEVKNGCALVQVTRTGDTWTAEAKWRKRTLAAKFANPVLVDGHIYGIHNSDGLVCLNAETGEQKWKAGHFGAGQLLARGDKLVVVSADGEAVLVAIDPREYRELGRFEALKGKTWNTPALAGNHLFVRNEEAMACYELPTK